MFCTGRFNTHNELTQLWETIDMKKTLATIITAVAALGASTAAHAYTTIGYWNSNNITMRGSSVSFPAGAWRNALSTVTGRIFNNPSECWITHQWGDTSVGIDNGQNEVWFSSSSQHNPAVTYIQYSFWHSNRIVEADVVFWSGVSYTTSMNKLSLWPYGGASRPFETTAMHEYGHVLGLGHEAWEYNIMGSDWTHIHLNGSTCRSYLGEDASDGLISIYGAYSGGEIADVSISHWRYLGRSGEYSTHQLCAMYTSTGTLMTSTAFNGQRRYDATRGQVVRPQFTFENNGELSKTVRVGFYLSTDSVISTGDRFLGYRWVTVSRGNVDTLSTSYVTIPTDVTRGATYYLGAIIDDNSALGEIDESNNAAYHIVRIN